MRNTNRAPAMEETRNYYLFTVLTATTIIAMIYIGGANSFSILYKELLDFYHTRSGDTAIIPSLCQFLNFGIGPFANYLSEIYSFRAVMIVGGFLGFLGLFLSAFVPRMEFWILTYGVLTGVGFGLVYSPCFTVVNFYFKRRRALALGIVLFGTGVGSVLFPFLYKVLVDLYGLQGAVLVISAISLNMCVCAALIRQPKELKKSVLLKVRHPANCEMESFKEHTTSTSFPPCRCAVCRPKRPIFCFSLFRQSSFLVYALAFMCSIFAFLSNFVMIPGYARVQGMTSANVAEFLSVAGGVTIFARPAIGWLADSSLIEKRNIIGTCVILGGIFSIVLPWILGYYSMLVYSISFGIFPGSFFLFIPLLLLEIVPLEKLPQAQGLLYLCLSLSAGLSQPVPGWIKDLTGDWTVSFRVSGCISILAGVLFMTEPILGNCRKMKTVQINHDDM